MEGTALHLPIRMVESEYGAIRNFMADYPVIVLDLQNEIRAAQDTAQAASVQVSQCKHWLRRMTEFKFVAVSLALLDYDKQFKIFSKKEQSDTDLGLDYPTNHELFENSLKAAAAGTLGSHVNRNLASLKSGKYAGVTLRGMGVDIEEASGHTAIDPDHFEIEAIAGKQKAGRGYQYCIKWLGYSDKENTWEAAGRIKKTAAELVEAYERGDSVCDQQDAARRSRAARREAFREPEESTATLANLSDKETERAQAAIEARVKGYAIKMAEATLERFHQRLPMPLVLIHLRAIFDYRRMPWCDNDKLLTWSDDSVKWLVDHKFPHLDVAVVQAEAMKVRLWLREAREQFRVAVKVHDNDGNVVKGQTKQVLAMTGEGGIYHALFTQYNDLFPSGIRSYLEALDYNIAFIFSSCSTERIGRNMTLTKPPERGSLGDDNFKMLVWISYNSPPVHEINFEKYLKIWTAEKHQLALFKEEGGEQRVLTRKSLEHKHTILSTRVIN